MYYTDARIGKQNNEHETQFYDYVDAEPYYSRRLHIQWIVKVTI
jgi:hypothetical protein